MLKKYFSTVKKLTAILFLFIYLFSATEFAELFKINMLVKHFYETNKTGKQVDFLGFLVMHYVTDDLNDKDNDRDEQLPFKSPENYVLTSTSLYTPLQFVPSSLATQKVIANKADLFALKDWFIVKDFKILVWHPPQNT
jgi:hypothetical protein